MDQKFVIKGTSMLPFFKPGDIVIINPIQPYDVRKRQIIAFTCEVSKELVIHRVLKVFTRNKDFFFIARGDGSRGTDPPLVESDLKGKVIGKVENGEVRQITRLQEIITYHLSKIYWVLRRVARGPFYTILNVLLPVLPISVILLRSASGFKIKVTILKRLIAQRLVREGKDILWCNSFVTSSRRKQLAKQLKEYDSYKEKNE